MWKFFERLLSGSGGNMTIGDQMDILTAVRWATEARRLEWEMPDTFTIHNPQRRLGSGTRGRYYAHIGSGLDSFYLVAELKTRGCPNWVARGEEASEYNLTSVDGFFVFSLCKKGEDGMGRDALNAVLTVGAPLGSSHDSLFVAVRSVWAAAHNYAREWGRLNVFPNLRETPGFYKKENLLQALTLLDPLGDSGWERFPEAQSK